MPRKCRGRDAWACQPDETCLPWVVNLKRAFDDDEGVTLDAAWSMRWFTGDQPMVAGRAAGVHLKPLGRR
ncbi:hypothetical protein DVT68_03615 [Dyella solisilvae]|uniref:Uncharacterized protein n=1 Tax=Dyella solisilvae TaxID=1920168 RepID=A0A370KB93_9GAMM|nr:hypothetical protein DVT68_03615 [Dyella solisilvae]